MSTLIKQAGATDVSVVIRIIDSTDGTPETGVVFNTSGIDLWYRREGAASVDITEADLSTPALTDAHADGGFLHINDGWYRLDLPDAACASGAAGVQIGGTVTGMVVLAPYIQLDIQTAADVADAVFDEVLSGHTTAGTAGERLGRIPNATAGGNGGLPTVDANNRVAGIQGTITTLDGLDTAQDTQHAQTQSDIAGLNDPTAAAIADAIWDEAQADHVAAGSFGVVASEVADILVDTAVIGAAGAGLTAVPWNAAWDSEVQSEAQDAITASFTFSNGNVSANIEEINTVTITGNGQTGTEFSV